MNKTILIGAGLLIGAVILLRKNKLPYATGRSQVVPYTSGQFTTKEGVVIDLSPTQLTPAQSERLEMIYPSITPKAPDISEQYKAYDSLHLAGTVDFRQFQYNMGWVTSL